jgi:hypothetical protein
VASTREYGNRHSGSTKMCGNSEIAERLLASQEELCSIELDS